MGMPVRDWVERIFRPKDLTDLERLVAINTAVDVARVRKLIADAMGEDDERV